MPKVLIFDIDRGLKSIGSDERIEQAFGYRPRRFASSTTLLNTFNKLFEQHVNITQDELGDVEEEVYMLRSGRELDFFVMDSITAYQAQKKKDEKGTSDRITLPMWGNIGEAIEDIVVKAVRTNVNAIMIGHTKSEEDKDLGVIKQIPALSGRMKDEIARYFDIVAYTTVETDKLNGQRIYKWIMMANERCDAKCRLESVTKYLLKNNGEMPQDFELLFNLINEGGYEATKMLILGNAGTGKTYALRTLKNVTNNNNKQ